MFRKLFSLPFAARSSELGAPYTGELDQGIIIAIILIALFVAFITVKGMRRK
ncbi:MAG: hypothetical protein IJ457_00940 [Clostridia bacterium]|nr:hypothetical protein [Clostridia bacterium]